MISGYSSNKWVPDGMVLLFLCTGCRGGVIHMSLVWLTSVWRMHGSVGGRLNASKSGVSAIVVE